MVTKKKGVRRAPAKKSAAVKPALRRAKAKARVAAKARAKPVRAAEPAAAAAVEAAERRARFLASPAPISVEQMQELDEAVAADSGDVRRAALAVLTRSGQELATATLSEEGARTAAFLVACIERYRGPLAAMLELVDTASGRVLLALEPRADSAALLAAARLEASPERGLVGHA